ncbi:hypothetical protein ElyMa_005095500 [Elysia marginata]|uniref:Uncharacterized protein n=1 Tax=Elysia marginata TaxID=1093978 RepID=A0AAV4JGK1_9GAST|nr:hypothetical protein ElyMa_005095500 [Elysia marginata]
MPRKRRGGSVGRLTPSQKRMQRQRKVNKEAGNKHEPEAQLNDFTNIPAHILTEAQIEAQEVVRMKAQINPDAENNSQITNPDTENNSQIINPEPEINPQIQEAKNNVLTNPDPPAFSHSKTNVQPICDVNPFTLMQICRLV